MRDNIYSASNIDDNEEWGDDELTAIDLSAAFLLERADWTTFYNQKGYEGQYPYLLYAHDDADVLNDRLMAEVNRAQVLKGQNKLQVDLFTKFIENQNGDIVGMSWLCVNGLRSIATDLKEDLIWLFSSGTSDYLSHSYSTHGVVVDIEWFDDWAEIPQASLFDDKKPPKGNLDKADCIKFATLIPR
ncbi:hypothetical protein QYZ87_10545 [Porphyromonadaceae bacterium W3.11]|nr:hypothetical protein [Porphyromonadaceae bacterium W3.11]